MCCRIELTKLVPLTLVLLNSVVHYDNMARNRELDVVERNSYCVITPSRTTNEAMALCHTNYNKTFQGDRFLSASTENWTKTFNNEIRSIFNATVSEKSYEIIQRFICRTKWATMSFCISENSKNTTWTVEDWSKIIWSDESNIEVW